MIVARTCASTSLCLVLLWFAPASPAAQPTTAGQLFVVEGVRLIDGTGRGAVENAAIVVRSGRIAAVGTSGQLARPVGAAVLSMAGKTVIPALIDGHSHIGYMKGLSSGAVNYTRANIIDHLHRMAYFGVAATQAMGSDFGEVPFAIRDETAAGTDPDAARFLTAGRGLAPLSEISADNMRQAAYPVTTPEGARASVQELAVRHVPIVKTWVDDRGGAVQMLPPAIYSAILDEAHRTGMRVAVHATDPAVASVLLDAGIDIFAHMISRVDDELVARFRQHPSAVVLSALGGPHRAVYAPWLSPAHPLILQTIRPDQIARLQGRFPLRNPDERARAAKSWDDLADAVRRLHAAGVRIGVGTDGGGQQGDQFLGWTMHAELENLVMAGLTPMEALLAATRDTAEILKLESLGTVAPGKSADFVVLDANPLDDITNTRRITAVYLRGHAVDRARLAGEFAEHN